ncbi:MAG: alpha-L-rhamnosidase C-terminal domain-containing protein, partial [Salinivenus sp.]
SGLPIDSTLLAEPWPAQWIAPPEADGRAFGVYHFRRVVTLEAAPDSFVVHTSADNRYQLFVNGERVRVGPARGEIPNWRFETTDLAPHLEAGTNVIAAVVWNFGEHRPVAQFSHRTGFLLQANAEAHATVNTSGQWRVTENEAYAPIPRDSFNVEGYLVVGPGERVDASRYPWGWRARDYDDSGWASARELGPGMPTAGPGPTGIHEAWLLTPRTIPRMETRVERFGAIDRARGVEPEPGVLDGEADLVIPPNTEATLLLDKDSLTTAYPVFRMSGGDGARLKVTYAEALYDEEGLKGNRDETAGKTIRGYHDVYRPDGGDDRRFRPLWWRTFRYVQLDITTGDAPLRLHDAHSLFTAYPFEENASFTSDNPTLDRIWTVAWRTARLCANETYFDTPYWEQLQYVGDTRIQALISLYVDGDDRLMRKSIRAYDRSRISEGLTASRYPSHEQQFIPTYSLFWVSMVHDYWMHRDDPAFVRSFLTPIRSVLEWYEPRVDETGLVGPTPWWNFVDWTFDTGVPPGAEDGHSTIVSLQLAYALDHAADLAAHFDRPGTAEQYRTRSAALKKAVREQAWDAERGLLADTPEKAHFSHHANILGVLTDLFPEGRETAVMERVLADTSLTEATYYFRFYLHRAMKEAGLGDRYIEGLEPWREMLSQGLTTFAEEPVPTRSDSHAWSAHPNYQFLSLVAGITPAAPGFAEVRVAPALGPLERVEAEMPHPDGPIRVDLERQGETGLTGTVALPDGLTGTFEWRGQTVALDGGTQSIEF